MISKISRKNIKSREGGKKNRLLIAVNVIGSAGPLRLLVNEDDTVSTVIDSSLKLYARGGRLPLLGSDFNDFLLFVFDAPSNALSPSEAIGLCGGRTFVMSKKKITCPQIPQARSDVIIRQMDVHSWKSWFNNINKSFKIISH